MPRATADGKEVQAERVPEEPPASLDAFLAQTRQPQFIDSAYFLKFKFEQGKYALVGRETLDGQDLLRIEYYPARLFSNDRDREAEREKRRKPDEKPKDNRWDAKMEEMMNKISLVTIWVEPKSYQIVKYTFDNVNFDFLPAAWLVRVNDLKASMTMSQPVKDVKDLWLPRDIDWYFSAMLAIGTFDVRYHLEYHDYRQATTSGRIKGGRGAMTPVIGALLVGMMALPAGQASALGPGPWAFLQAQAPTGEVITEILVHGNHVTSDAEIIKLAGISVGAPFGADDHCRYHCRGSRLRTSSMTSTS